MRTQQRGFTLIEIMVVMVVLSKLGVPWGFSLLGAMVITGLLGSALERGLLRPLVGRPVFVTIIVTIFISMILRAITIIVFGTETRGMPTPWDSMASVEIFGASLLWNSLGAMIGCVLALLAFFLMMSRTRMGITMRATASDQETAMALGIPVGRVLAATWFVAGATAALGGVFLGSSNSTISPIMRKTWSKNFQDMEKCLSAADVLETIAKHAETLNLEEDFRNTQ